jgi:hypothetical protein
LNFQVYLNVIVEKKASAEEVGASKRAGHAMTLMETSLATTHNALSHIVEYQVN